ncbi:S-adenosyl-L-methionine-dependent methyltransferase [Phellopilus nigrolimitatus]|nr:S-adenosyl-L-methionine-dependent methyltransferase [Phellopilus nigrolimitatus]
MSRTVPTELEAQTTTTTTSPIPHVARNFHKYPGANYVLPSDEQEAARLKLQHDILKVAFEGRIILTPVNSQTGYFVLDSGVGPGAWLLDAASELSSSAILHGIDIDSRLFPRSHPSNASFSVNSIVSLPVHWSNKFDIVHQRLLVAALKRSEWRQALDQIYRVLCPGGWVQLGEVGTWHGGPVTEKHARMLRALFESRELLLEVSTDIPDLLRAAKFVNVRVEKRTIPLGSWAGKYGTDARDDFMGIFRGMKTPILNSGGLGFVETEEAFDCLLDELEKEWDNTRGAEFDFHIICAQKPQFVG